MLLNTCQIFPLTPISHNFNHRPSCHTIAHFLYV